MSKNKKEKRVCWVKSLDEAKLALFDGVWLVLVGSESSIVSIVFAKKGAEYRMFKKGSAKDWRVARGLKVKKQGREEFLVFEAEECNAVTNLQELYPKRCKGFERPPEIPKFRLSKQAFHKSL